MDGNGTSKRNNELSWYLPYALERYRKRSVDSLALREKCDLKETR
jgi:hypothetical protein